MIKLKQKVQKSVNNPSKSLKDHEHFVFSAQNTVQFANGR